MSAQWASGDGFWTDLISWRWLFVLSIVCALVVSASAQQPDPPALILSSRTDLVVLPVTVLDRGGQPVPGLTQADFAVYENNVMQPVTFLIREDSPATVGLIIDNSGSMRMKRDDVVAAATAFARSSNPSDELFTLNFNEHVWMGLPPDVPFSDNPEQLRLALSTMTTDGVTALYDATIAALDHIEAGTTMRKVLIIVSDGGDNASRQSLADVINQARRADVVIYAVGLIDEEDEDADRGVLKQLARLTGGDAYFPDRTRDVTRVFERIATEIRAGYTLGTCHLRSRETAVFVAFAWPLAFRSASGSTCARAAGDVPRITMPAPAEQLKRGWRLDTTEGASTTK